MCDCYKIPEKIKIKYNKLLLNKKEEDIEPNVMIAN